MRTPRIYTTQSLADLGSITLEEQSSHHLMRVLRLRCGAPLLLFNGDGKEYSGVFTHATGNQAVVALSGVSEPARESHLQITLGQGISRGERMDFVLQKCAELGVASVAPLRTRRSQVQLSGNRLEKRLNHWRAVIRSACEQSGRTVIPALDTVSTVEQWCGSLDVQLRLVLDPAATLQLRELERADSIAILIGPEGGLDQDELRVAETNGFQRIRLGPRTLRTETAALAALSAVQTLWGDMAG